MPELRLRPDRFQVADPSLTVDEFCAAERIGRSQLYKQWREGRGPRYFLNGSHRRISHEARIEWRHRMELAAETNGGNNAASE
jgi:hypothetical protein